MTNENSPERILKLVNAFMESRILLSAAELNLFTLLQKEPLSAREIADRVNGEAEEAGDARAVSALLDATAALGFLRKQGETYFCEPDVARLLADDSPVTVRPMALHMAFVWHKWSQLTSIAKGAPESNQSNQQAEFLYSPKNLEAFIGAMHAVGAPLAGEVAADIDTENAESFIDIGGGSGTYTMAFLRKAPAMKATLFDLPEVVEMARTRLAREGFLDRVTLVPGSFYSDELPGEHDLALLSAIIHSNSLEENLDLYRKAFHALRPGGRLLIRDHVMEPDRTHPVAGAIFAINMLVETQSGGCYTYAEIETGLREAGFTGIRMLRRGERMDAVVEARRPQK
uniref:O-methyltransferase, family 2 n=1 Tax=uncultured bacterium contig00009 TaxID=1181501 RepID=A0A806JZX1_9BACT|nr:O-methyltransferase, family 2 [uncultured bacterium contig00009]